MDFFALVCDISHSFIYIKLYFNNKQNKEMCKENLLKRERIPQKRQHSTILGGNPNLQSGVPYRDASSQVKETPNYL